MSNVVTTLLDFILELLRNPQAAAEYQSNPQAAIDNAGLSGVTPADVNASMGMVADCSPVRDWQSEPSGYHPGTGGAPAHSGGYQPSGHPSSGYHPSGVDAYHAPQPEHCDDDDHKPWEDHKPWDDHGQGQEFAVFQHIENIQQTTTITKIDASHSIWVGGDVNVLFGEDNVLNTGSGALLNNVDSFGGVSVDNTHVDVSLTDSLNGSLNHIDGDGNAVGTGNTVDNSDHSIDNSPGAVSGNDNTVDNSTDDHSSIDNSDHSVDVSFDDLNLGDNSGNNENATDSGNTGSIVGTNSDAQIGDNTGSGNTVSDGSVNTAGGDQHVGSETTIGDISDNNLALGPGSQIADDGAFSHSEDFVVGGEDVQNHTDDSVNDSSGPLANDTHVDVHDPIVLLGDPGLEHATN